MFFSKWCENGDIRCGTLLHCKDGTKQLNMLLPLKTICSGTKVRRDGTSLIFIQYCKSETNKTLLNTGIAIPFSYWNNKSGRIAGNLLPAVGNAEKLNLELHRMFRLAEDIIQLAINLKFEETVSFVKKTFRQDLPPS
jgi:hypothetical protein